MSYCILYNLVRITVIAYRILSLSFGHIWLSQVVISDPRHTECSNLTETRWA